MAKPRPKADSDESVKKGTGPVALDDPALESFTQGVQALHKKSWAKAAELFEAALEKSDRPDLSARARQYLATARQQTATAPTKDAAEDPFLRAVYEKNRGNLAAALEISRKDGRDQKDERFAYLVASIHAVEGRTEEAAQALSRAIEQSSKNRVHAYHDPDFAELRKDRDHRQKLFGLS